MLVGALVSVPLWTTLSNRVKNNQFLITMAAIGIAITSFPMTFISGYLGFTIAMFFWGMAFGGFWLLMTPAMSDVIDESVVKTGKREDAVMLGFRAFFGRLSYAMQALSFFVVHWATGFDSENLTSLAIFGIHIHLAILPTIYVLIGAFIFWRLNTLNPDKMDKIHQQLDKMNL
jgi:Na+/melibiose symporter-like transporter